MKLMRNNQSGFGHVVILAVVAVIVLLVAVGYNAWRAMGTKDDNQSLISNQEDKTVDSLPIDLSSLKSLEEIQALASTDIAGNNVLGIELEMEDGKTVYVLHLSDGSTLFYNAFTGVKLQLTDDDDDGNEVGNALPADFVAGITIQEAITIAQDKRPDSKLKKVELEVEDGVAVYSVRFTDDSRVNVSAADGSVLLVKDESGKVISKTDDDFDDDGVNNTNDTNDDDDDLSDDDDSNDFHEDDDSEDDDESGSSNSGSDNY